MMGIKPRNFYPIEAVTLEHLVPADHFYRHLDRMLDLSFVRNLVRDCYAAGGRPSIDPVVFFRLQLGCPLGVVLRRHPLRAPTHGSGGRPPEPALVLGL
jgi:hypothetical protein